MNRKWLWASLLAVPLAVGGGLAFAATQVQSFTCPFTGQEISWGNCCPLSGCHQEPLETSGPSPGTVEEPSGESCCTQSQ